MRLVLTALVFTGGRGTGMALQDQHEASFVARGGFEDADDGALGSTVPADVGLQFQLEAVLSQPGWCSAGGRSDIFKTDARTQRRFNAVTGMPSIVSCRGVNVAVSHHA
jgi:hypothetical protein